jgi:hypothetical protein
MTNFKQAPRNKSRGNNIKDGGSRPRRNRSNDDQFEDLGFKRIDWNKWSYTWPGNFPVFRLVPGWTCFGHGWIAIHDESDHRIPLGPAKPTEIKTRLDDEILAIMRYDAEIDDSIDQEMIELGREIGF